MTPHEIAVFVTQSESISTPDGMPNVAKFYFILEVFECDAINLNDYFDYNAVINTGDLLLIQAAQYLASLQWEFSTRCHLEKHTSEKNYQEIMAYLTLCKAKMSWATSFLVAGREAPTYPFVN